jgi:hypothetical protein
MDGTDLVDCDGSCPELVNYLSDENVSLLKCSSFLGGHTPVNFSTAAEISMSLNIDSCGRILDFGFVHHVNIN